MLCYEPPARVATRANLARESFKESMGEPARVLRGSLGGLPSQDPPSKGIHCARPRRLAHAQNARRSGEFESRSGQRKEADHAALVILLF